MSTPPPPMITIDATALTALLPPSVLIPHLRSSLPSLAPAISTPSRLSFPIDPPLSSSLLIMPSWSTHPSLPYISVKLLTSFPSSSPSISASLSLFHSLSGLPLATLDATRLTLLRTSAISALAASLLLPQSSSNPQTLLLLGSGALASHLIAAHRSAHPSLSRFLVWNRTPHRARLLVSQLQALERDKGAAFLHIDHEGLDSAVSEADLLVCATASERAIVKGELLKEGAHLSLMGSFRREMRECDEAAVRRGRVVVDCEEAAETAGEIAGVEGVEVAGTLAELLRGEVTGRRGKEEVTVFKSVGSGAFDLLAAQLAYETYLKGTVTAPLHLGELSK